MSYHLCIIDLVLCVPKRQDTCPIHITSHTAQHTEWHQNYKFFLQPNLMSLLTVTLWFFNYNMKLLYDFSMTSENVHCGTHITCSYAKYRGLLNWNNFFSHKKADTQAKQLFRNKSSWRESQGFEINRLNIEYIFDIEYLFEYQMNIEYIRNRIFCKLTWINIE